MSDYGYTPNEISSEEFLSEAPLDLIRESIKTQFSDPIEYNKKDYIASFINMYKYSEANASAFEDEDTDSIHYLRDNFYGFMLAMFEKKLGVGIDNFDEMSMDDQDEIVHYVYRFFLSNCKKNFTNIVMNHIDENHDEYAAIADDEEDVTKNSMKRYVDDPADVYVLSHLRAIIQESLNADMDVDEFFDRCDNSESPCLETAFVRQKYDDFTLTGNFVPMYFDLTDYKDFFVEIESKVRHKILKKYNKKKD